MTIAVAIYVYPDVEVLDFAGPFEVFTTAARMHARRAPESAPLFAPCILARSLAPVRARGGLRIVPDFTCSNAPQAQVLIVPGGVVDAERQDAALLDWLRQTAAGAELVASVCTGSFLLAQAGLLDGKSATTHWEDLADLRDAFPAVEVRADVRWVDAGRILSSAGIAAGIDMALHLVARLHSPELARLTARQMDVPWSVQALT